MIARDYLLVVDELRTLDGKEHTFDWLYHNKGSNISCGLPVSKAGPGKLPPGYAYLQDINAFEVSQEEPFEIIFPGERVTTRLTMLGRSGDEVFTATGPFSGVADRVPVTIVRRKGKVVRFISLIEPEIQKQPKVKMLTLIPGNSLQIEITLSEGEDLVSFPTDGLESFSVSTGSGSSGRTQVLTTESGK